MTLSYFMFVIGIYCIVVVNIIAIIHTAIDISKDWDTFILYKKKFPTRKKLHLMQRNKIGYKVVILGTCSFFIGMLVRILSN